MSDSKQKPRLVLLLLTLGLLLLSFSTLSIAVILSLFFFFCGTRLHNSGHVLFFWVYISDDVLSFLGLRGLLCPRPTLCCLFASSD